MLPSPHSAQTCETDGAPPQHPVPPHVKMFGIAIHQVTMDDAIDWGLKRMQGPAGPCELVFTPNVDHIVQLNQNLQLRDAYGLAGLVVADGWPVVTASRWLKKALPARVAGSDLVPALIAAGASQHNPRIFLLGGAAGVAEKAAARIRQRWPKAEIVGTDSPPFGFETQDDENQRIVAKVNESAPDLLVVGFGAPKQELWLARHRSQLNAKIAVAAGGTIDFLAGHQTRAPRWAQQARLEWLHRMLTNPRRLAGRYLKGAIVFPRLVIREYRTAADQ
ncbi:Putative N-acetylmannosaminyltransferase [Symmachiella dynata]|uniref:WecB/TagA/CpsF family glycosyltransferase n=1 Tax=Symmachiella dynata TaxID=2527995 RepID=UPI00118A2D19|nr:WecB/TagA/CpsF family glycosyltransferase [Symmachiella dynata]QDT47264.1 Putative N-acetylmannosaminyltransferase [Symmachiella dynata]